MYFCEIPSPLGMLTASSDGTNITGLWIEEQKYFPADASGGNHSLDVFDQLKLWLDSYFSGKQPDNMPPLAPQGSDFRREVWDILLSIPYGQTITYGDIAKRIAEKSGKKTSARAVGGAVGRNPISIVIPCHRVVGAKGSLTGYAGGIDNKIKLLEIEGAL